jgi:CubicO group peptidase (beta-lactamase class C family)
MFAGIPAELESRVAFLEEVSEPQQTPAQPLPAPNPAEQGVSPCMNPLAEWMNRSDARRACIPASNSIMNARAMARHYAALLPGGVDGVELIPAERLRVATRQEKPFSGYEEGVTPHRGLGYVLGEGGSSTGFGHGGYGGSTAYGDPRYRLAVGVIRNRFSSNNLVGLVTKEIRSALGIS